MKNLRLLLLSLVFSLTGCGDGATEKLGPAGGTIKHGGAQVDIPPGALVREQKVTLVEASDTKAVTYTSAGPAFTLSTEQAAFARPVTITLPLDVSALPSDATPDRISVMLAQDGFGEQLDGARVDLAAGTVTVTLERAVPLIHAQGAPAGAGAPPVLQAAIGPVMGMVLNTERVIYQAGSNVVGAQQMAEDARTLMKLVLNKYQDVNVPQPTKIVVEFLNEDKGAEAFTTSANIPYIGVSVPYWSQANSQRRVATLAHEYFHIIQHGLVAQNLKKTGTLVRPEIMAAGSERWLYEATATWMETHLIPGAGTYNAPRLTRDFGYLPLNHYDEVTRESVAAGTKFHQYAAFSFFSYLDTLYVGRNIVTRFWSEYLSGSWARSSVADDAQRGAGSFGQLDHLDHILKTTPDNTGRKRNLREAYANFLLHYYYYKDFDPVSCGLEKELGKPRDLALPNRLVAWSLPEGDVRQKTMTVNGGPFAIVKTFDIRQKLDPKAKEKLDLEVSLGLAERADPKESLLIVFPYKKKVEAPLVGNAKSRVQLKDWQDYVGAVVWVVDLSAHGGWDLIMTAEVKKPEPTPSSTAITLKAEGFPAETDQTEIGGTIWIRQPTLPGDEPSKYTEIRERLGPLRKIKESKGGSLWAYVTVTIGERKNHVYCEIHPGLEGQADPYVVGLCPHITLNLPRRLGDFQAQVKTSILGQALTSTFPISVKLAPGGEQQAREDIQSALRELASFTESNKFNWSPMLYRRIGSQHEKLREDQDAVEAYNKSMVINTERGYDSGPEDFRSAAGSLAHHALLIGDIEGYLSWAEKAGWKPDWIKAAEQMVKEKNDCAGARALLIRTMADTGLKPGKYEMENYLDCPMDGDTVLK